MNNITKNNVSNFFDTLSLELQKHLRNIFICVTNFFFIWVWPPCSAIATEGFPYSSIFNIVSIDSEKASQYLQKY